MSNLSRYFSHQPVFIDQGIGDRPRFLFGGELDAISSSREYALTGVHIYEYGPLKH